MTLGQIHSSAGNPTACAPLRSASQSPELPRRQTPRTPRQGSDPATPIWRDDGHFQHEGCEIGDLRGTRRRQRSQARDVFLGDVRLLHKAVDFALLLQGILFLSRHPATLATNTRTLSFAAKSLVRSDAFAENAESAHPSPLLKTPRPSSSTTATRSARTGARRRRVQIRQQSSPR